MAWTNEQLDAINSEGSNIIVSAGAGSGKTAVLTERVIRKLKCGVDIDRLLVLTFTNEAANETDLDLFLKNRISGELNISVKEAAAAFELLNIMRFKNILGNIIYLGLEDSQNKLFLKEKKQK